MQRLGGKIEADRILGWEGGRGDWWVEGRVFRKKWSGAFSFEHFQFPNTVYAQSVTYDYIVFSFTFVVL